MLPCSAGESEDIILPRGHASDPCSPQQHPSKKVCGRWDRSGPAGCWGAVTAGAAPGLAKCSAPNLAPTGTMASGDWRGTQEQPSRRCLQEARTAPRPPEPGHLQEEHSSPCHVWGQAAHQFPNPCPPEEWDKHHEAMAAPSLLPNTCWEQMYRGRWARQHQLPCT